MNRCVVLLGPLETGLDLAQQSVRDAGLSPRHLDSLDAMPREADTVSGLPLLIADAHALAAQLEEQGSAERVAGVELIVIGDESDQDRLSRWLDSGRWIFLHPPINTGFLRDLLDDFGDETTCPQNAIDAASPPIELDRFGYLYGSSGPMHRLFRMLRKAAASDATLCLYGESGTGKELAARSVHQFSARSAEPFKAVNCSAIPRELFESELFGHEKGSFSGAVQAKAGLFESVGKGTLLLDEITEMDKDMQAKLLRVLESGVFQRVGGHSDIECRARILAATNRRPAEAVQFGRLREDLYYRISQLEVHLPPLRERPEDVPPLARLFARDYGRETGKKVRLSAAAEDRLRSYAWPGNVRQLWNVVQLACTRGAGLITPEDLPDLDDQPEPLAPAESGTDGSPQSPGVTLRIGTSLEDAERTLIEATLAQVGGERQRAAAILGISLRTLYNRLRRYRHE
jgi:DNA-binding NtrC family response regulator